MARRTNRKIIDEWIEKNGPNGQSKLAVESGISNSLISKARNGDVPKKMSSRIRLARFLNVSEDDLFPLENKGKKAS